eukprot:1014671_1
MSIVKEECSQNGPKPVSSGTQIRRSLHANTKVKPEHSIQNQRRLPQMITVGFKCEVCSQTFQMKDHLIQHVSESHPLPVKLEQVAKSVRTSENPSRIGNQGGFYNCKICGKSFQTRHELTSHSHRHVGVRSYPCRICERIFKSNSTLGRHLRCHSGLKPFACDL